MFQGFDTRASHLPDLRFFLRTYELMSSYELTTHPFSTINYLSLLLGTDPSPWIQDIDLLE
jgi:hypothetical protein